MIVALMIGRKGSTGFPNKNIIKIYNKCLCEYPLIAVKKVKSISKIFISTDCPSIKKVTKKYNPVFLNRPKKLATNSALGEHVFQDAYYKIKDILKGKKIDMLVLLMANAGTINARLIRKGISILNRNKDYDSAVTTSVYNMWSPIRARTIKNGMLKPFVPFKFMGGTKINCDRDAQGEVHYADMSASIVRPKCLENLDKGLLPQKWMGNKIASIRNESGFDIDFEWQLPQLKYWIKKYASKK
jgi:CMP-N-acetylneuraminic acid synthetase